MSNIVDHVASLFTGSNVASLLSSSRAAVNGSLEGSSLLCFVKLLKLYNGLAAGDVESLYFLDGLGKPASGLLYGDGLLLGDYDLCQKMKENSKGYYRPCLTHAAVQLSEGGIAQQVTWTTCLPEECHGSTFTDLLNTSVLPQLAQYNVTVSNMSSQCEVPLHWGLPAYIALALMSLFLVMCAIGTLWGPIEELLTSDHDVTGDVTGEDEDDEQLINDQSGGEPASSGSDTVSPATDTGVSKKRSTLRAVGAVMKCFDVQRNMTALLSTDAKPGQLLSLHGVRVLSIHWVVLGHIYYMPWALGAVGDSAYGFTTLLNRSSFQYITNGVLAVDSFFLLSGFLVSYLLLKELAQRGTFNPVSYVLHRYIRLTVPYLMVILVEAFLYPAVVQGPFTTLLNGTSEACRKHMWSNLLYLNNFIPHDQRNNCIGQAWYLANDFQFYLVAPVFILALFYKPRIGSGMLWGSVGGSIAGAGISYYYYNFNLAEQGGDSYFLHQYIKPWIRAPPYLIGIFGGWVCWRFRAVFSRPATLVRLARRHVWRRVLVGCVVWSVTLLAQWSVLQGKFQDMNIHHHSESQSKDIAYEMLSRPVWAATLLVQIMACQAGLGGWIGSVLSWRGMIPLARLTYGVYLLHIGLLKLLIVQLRHPWFVAPDYEVGVLYCGVLAVSYAAAALLYVTVEQPVAFLEKLYYQRPST